MIPILDAKALTKHFGHFTAVDGVNLQVMPEKIHALIGPNGAGKTTVFNLIAKSLMPSSGIITFEGKDVTRMKTPALARMGLVRSFQISATFSGMSALENVRLALQSLAGDHYRFWGSSKDLARFEGAAKGLLEEVGLGAQAKTLASDLPYGQRRALEIATTIAMSPKLLLLDEPTQGMGAEDVDRIVQLIRSISKGRTVLMVEHNMGVVSSLASRISVLQRGKVISEGSYSEVSADPLVKEAYLGRQ